jgi:hypothetical protein
LRTCALPQIAAVLLGAGIAFSGTSTAQANGLGGGDAWRFIGPPRVNVPAVAIAGGAAPRVVAAPGRAGSRRLLSREFSGGPWVEGRLPRNRRFLADLDGVAGALRSGTIYAASSGLGTLRSTNGGRSWAEVGSETSGGSVATSADGSVVVAAGRDTGVDRAEIEISRDRGRTWGTIKLSASGRPLEKWAASAVVVDPYRPGTLYVAGSGRFVGDPLTAALPARVGVLVSRDGGASWRLRGTRGVGVPLSLAVARGRAGMVFVSTLKGVLRSRDFGARWSRVSRVVREDPTFLPGDLVVSPGRSPNVYFGDGRGIWVGCRGGAEWRKVGSRAGRTFVESVALSPDGRALIVSGRPGVSVLSTANVCR